MIAQNCEDTEGGAKMAESCRNDLRRNELPACDSLNDKVTEKNDKVRSARIDAGDYSIQLLYARER